MRILKNSQKVVKLIYNNIFIYLHIVYTSLSRFWGGKIWSCKTWNKSKIVHVPLFLVHTLRVISITRGSPINYR